MFLSKILRKQFLNDFCEDKCLIVLPLVIRWFFIICPSSQSKPSSTLCKFVESKSDIILFFHLLKVEGNLKSNQLELCFSLCFTKRNELISCQKNDLLPVFFQEWLSFHLSNEFLLHWVSLSPDHQLGPL